MEEIFKLAYDIHDLLQNSNEYKVLKEKEKIMEDDQTLLPLFALYKKSQEDYVNNKQESSLKKIKDLKIELETNPLVKEYNIAYKKYLELLDNITSVAFDGLIINDDDILKKMKCGCKK